MKLLFFQIFATTAIIFCVKNVVIQASHEIACEHAPAKTVSCPEGYYINVIKAFYGRQQADRCGHNKNTHCFAKSSPGIIKNNCQGEISCILNPSNSVFGDPCRGVVKYIELKYECLENEVIQASQVIACEHAPAKTVSCPAGHYINVITAFYGRQQADRCGHNSNTNCLAASSPGIIKNNCQGKNSCILKPSNSVFGDPCRGVVKYIEMKYECLAAEYAEDQPERAVACEHSDPVKVKCEHGTYINVLDAYYGRTSSDVCGHNRKTDCLASSSPNIIRNNCQGKNSCILKAHNSVFGDPCRGVRKYIELKYECTPEATLKTFACEHQHPVEVSCPAGHAIKVHQAFYGRRDIGTCGYKPVTDCEADGSYQKIKTQCQLQNKCTLTPTNALFGDPCKGVHKYVELNYQCVPHSFHERSITVCEGHKVDIVCPADEIVIITEGFYGRDDGYTCPGPIHTTHCKAASSLYKLKASCNFKRSCWLEANNGLFGDPCRGTKKFIKVKYMCF